MLASTVVGLLPGSLDGCSGGGPSVPDAVDAHAWHCLKMETVAAKSGSLLRLDKVGSRCNALASHHSWSDPGLLMVQSGEDVVPCP